MHAMLMDSAVAEPEKPGVPAKLLVNHKVSKLEHNEHSSGPLIDLILIVLWT